jgi:hypothetical protein
MLREWLTTAAAAPILHAAQAVPQGKFGTSVEDLAFPSLGRVVLGFLLTVALAVAVAFLLRRWWPSVLKRRSASGSIKSIERTAVSTTLTVHLVEVDGIRITVAEGRSGVGVAIMPGPRLSGARAGVAGPDSGPDSRLDSRFDSRAATGLGPAE